MTCDEARDAILVADLTELRANGSASPLVEHLAGCSRCRRLATAVASDTTALGAVVAPIARSRGVVSLRRLAIVAIPAAAAIAIAITLNAGRSDDVTVQATSLPVVREVSLTVAPGQRATVIKTPDPNVTVIWLSPGGSE